MFLLIMIIYLVCLQVNSDVIKDIPDTELAQYLTLGDIVAVKQFSGTDNRSKQSKNKMALFERLSKKMRMVKELKQSNLQH